MRGHAIPCPLLVLRLCEWPCGLTTTPVVEAIFSSSFPLPRWLVPCGELPLITQTPLDHLRYLFWVLFSQQPLHDFSEPECTIPQGTWSGDVRTMLLTTRPLNLALAHLVTPRSTQCMFITRHNQSPGSRVSMSAWFQLLVPRSGTRAAQWSWRRGWQWAPASPPASCESG